MEVDQAGHRWWVDAPPEPHRMRLATVYDCVQDLDRALQFYTDVLGLPLKHRFGDRWAEVEAGSVTIGLHPVEEGEQVQGEGGGTASFTVENIETLAAQLREKGASVGEIRNPPRGKFMMVTDPDGNQLHFIEFSPNWRNENRY